VRIISSIVVALLLASSASAKILKLDRADIVRVEQTRQYVRLVFTAAVAATVAKYSPRDSVQLMFLKTNKDIFVIATERDSMVLEFPTSAAAAAFAKSVSKPKT
jgi:hypothetical protein